MGRRWLRPKALTRDRLAEPIVRTGFREEPIRPSEP